MTDLPAGRELDFRVAQALGYTVYKIDYGTRRPEWVAMSTWDEWNDRPYIDDRARGYGKITLPRFSQPKNITDRAALLECVMWLANQGVYLAIDRDYAKVEITCDTPVSVPGNDMAAFALAICRAIVRA